ncbi:hypothetical protein F4781DRAFT_385781 [Annulohypoxylon bovei var. microspora]|nr:hypothetical protein F4781DRAFT_385781 [Annulohypoxylon bovei var. microspora]
MKFKWAPEHLKSKDLAPHIHTYDTVVAETVERQDEISSWISKTGAPEDKDDTRVAGKKEVKRDLYELIRQHGTTDEKIQRFWNEVNTA